MFRTLKMGTVAAVVALTVGCATVPVETYDGLVLRDDTEFKAVYEKPGVSLESFDKFAVVPCSVAFKDHWLREQNANRRALGTRVTEEDMTNIRTKLSAMCTELFSEVLNEAPAYKTVSVDNLDAKTLVLKPSIVNLDVVAPDVQSATRSRSYTTESGEMTLFLEVLDGHTGEILYRVIDRRRNTNTGRLEWTNSVTNTADARRALGYWGKRLRDGLDSAMNQQQP